jgi:hypothetical protein
VNPSLVAELAVLLREPPVAAEAAIQRRLREIEHAPPLAELLELGARARERRASDEELGLAIGALVALHAPRAGGFEH